MKSLLFNIFKKNIKHILILFILFFIYTFICAFYYVSAVSSNIQDSVLRLHVLANSDSEEDQDLKFKVRDNLINYMNLLCSNAQNKDEAIAIAIKHKDEFYTIAKTIILENGYNYPVEIEFGNFSFPTKTYGDIRLPSGYYDAMRVKIGNAEGQNWWCVMFPPLCFVNISSGIVPNESKNQLKEELSDEEYDIISTSDSSEINFKFKLIELFNFTNVLTAKK